MNLIERLPVDALLANKKLLFQQIWTQLVMLEDFRCEQMVHALERLYPNEQSMPEDIKFELEVVKLCRGLYKEVTTPLLEKSQALISIDIKNVIRMNRNILYLLGTAASWGGSPEAAAMYATEKPEKNDGVTPHALTVKDDPVDGFWSFLWS